MSGESDSDFLDRLAQSIADGSSIDWEKEIDRLPPDERLRGLLDLLKVVDGVAEVHRTLDDPPQPTDAVETPKPEPGTVHLEGGIGQWGKLVLLRKIGEGGFGVVYHAHDPWLDHPVALKLFKPRVGNGESSNRILHEARKLARIRHPNIVTVHGADSHDGQVGFWMDLIEGITLEQVVAGGRLSAGEATYIGQEVCRALAAVHLAGIVHRDVKAQNVMRATDGGRIILMDFGAGEFMKDQGSGGRKQGTPLYVAPELFNGSDGTPQSDIYAAGVLLYHLVTGGFPVRGVSVGELIEAHRRGERRRLRDVRPDLPDRFVSAVERALEPDATLRFESAGEMEGALAAESIRLDPLPFAPSTTRARLQNVAVGAASVFAFTALIGWIACRLFDTGVGVHSDLATRALGYLSVGATVLLPFVILWSVATGILALLSSISRPFVRRFDAIRTRIGVPRHSPDGVSIATAILVAGLGGWLAIVWLYSEVFSAIVALTLSAPLGASELSVLGSAGQPLHRAHYFYSAYLSLLLALAVWRWFPRLENHATDPDRVRLIKWATVVVAALTVVTAAAPWRLVWERFEVVEFESRPAFVIGSSSDELLLYYPYGGPLKHRRVRTDAPTLHRTGAQARLFDPR